MQIIKKCSPKIFILTVFTITILIMFSSFQSANAATAAATFSSGHIKYSSSAANVGSYSNMLTSCVNTWNSALSNRGCNASLTKVTSGSSQSQVIVSYTSTANYDQLGKVSLYSGSINVKLTDDATITNAFLYVYPNNMQAAINQHYPSVSVNNGIRYTTLHEFGHILGLMHDTNNNSSVMVQGLYNVSSPSLSNLDDLYSLWNS